MGIRKYAIHLLQLITSPENLPFYQKKNDDKIEIVSEEEKEEIDEKINDQYYEQSPSLESMLQDTFEKYQVNI